MPRHSAEFASALPGVAELKPLAAGEAPKSKGSKRREQTSLEKAQLMWDVYQDIKNAWVDLVRTKRSTQRTEDIVSIWTEAKESRENSLERVERLRF